MSSANTCFLPGSFWRTSSNSPFFVIRSWRKTRLVWSTDPQCLRHRLARPGCRALALSPDRRGRFFLIQLEALAVLRHFRRYNAAKKAYFANDISPKLIGLRLALLAVTAISFFVWPVLAYFCVFLLSLSALYVTYRGEMTFLDTASATLNLYVAFAASTRFLSPDPLAAKIVLISGGCVWLSIYFFAGAWKFSLPWLHGDALMRVLFTRAFGSPQIAQLVRGHGPTPGPFYVSGHADRRRFW